jgi:hypothetical protein
MVDEQAESLVLFEAAEPAARPLFQFAAQNERFTFHFYGA